MTNASGSLSGRPLFGGAIDLSLPTDYLDASDMRQIPDNQEVFLSSASETSIVIEILAMVEEGKASTDLYEAVKFHFESIAHDNSALQSALLSPAPATPRNSTQLSSPVTPEPVTLTGRQTIHKFSHNPTGAPRPGREADDPDEVWIGVALWRCWLGQKKADLVLSVNVNTSAEGGSEEQQRVEEWWLRMVGSLRIKDWGLFGDSE